MENNSLNILDLFGILKKRRQVFLLVCLPAVSISIICSFLMPKIYQATAIISYSIQEKGSGTSNLSSLSNILPSSFEILGGGEHPGEVVKLLESRAMAEKVINEKNLLPIFFDKKNFLSFLKKKNPTMRDGIRYIQDELNVEYDRLSNTINISFDFKDPEIAHDIVHEYIESLNKKLKYDTVSTAQKAIKAMEKQLHNVGDVILKERIYNMIVLQIEDITLAESKRYLNFKVIDPPRVPDKKIKPKRRLIVIITIFGSIMVSVFLILFSEHIEKLKMHGS